MEANHNPRRLSNQSGVYEQYRYGNESPVYNQYQNPFHVNQPAELGNKIRNEIFFYKK